MSNVSIITGERVGNTKVQIPVGQRMLEKYGIDISLCPKCNQGKLILIAIVYPTIFTTILPKEIGLRNKASPDGQ